MAQQPNLDTPTIGFRSIQLLKTKTLGIGSYGSVCKAKCDDLLCAAKIIHPTLYDPTAQQQIARHREHRLPFRRFQQECEFMSAIKHPNIVQYLGTHQDPETGLPVLLMELMDDSLTHFLESSQDPIPYHIQVNFCHDITMAISYLHSNGIIHRDLSSNNVLLHGNVIAKVTDFGMAKLDETNPRTTRTSLTMVPGTDAYMPPEAVKDQSVYTAKIDCFAIGALIIQILTRQWPKPGDRLKSIRIDHPELPGGIAQVNIPEIERRQNHISQVDPNHPLLPIALHCLRDSDVERPSAQELCHTVAALKEVPRYTESVRSAQERRPEQDSATEREEQIRDLQQQIQRKDNIIQEKDNVNHQLRQQHAQKIQECQQLREIIRDKDHLIEERERQLQHVNQQLENSNQVTAQLQMHIHDLEQQLKANPTDLAAEQQPSFEDHSQSHLSDTRSGAEKNGSFKLKWKKGKEAPSVMLRECNAAVDGDMVYITSDFIYAERKMYAYNTKDDTWNQLPDNPTHFGSLAIVNNLVTTIGGRYHGNSTNQLFSLTGEGQSSIWREVFPPMPTKRVRSIAVCNGQALIVAGGIKDFTGGDLRTVEVMEINTRQWSTAASLPEMLSGSSATICGDRIYILGGSSFRRQTNSVYTCSLVELFQSSQSRSLGEQLAQFISLTGIAMSTVWKKVANLPVFGSTCVTFCNQLLAIGGSPADNTPKSDVYIYKATSNQWEVISKMTIPRDSCFAAALPNNKIMVVGGFTGRELNSSTDSVEIASVI